MTSTPSPKEAHPPKTPPMSPNTTEKKMDLNELTAKVEGEAIRKDALISPCGKYRYWLTRTWNDSAPLLSIIMLNPSTADASIDDPTIRRCMSFARREEFGGIRVMNLFAYRATSPKEMLAVGFAACGADNGDHLMNLMVYARSGNLPVLAAWGAHGVHGMAKWVQDLAKVTRVRLVCLGKTSGGHPRHPLYVKGDQPFEPFGHALATSQ